ncbi:radical SAM/SPASM domain-containing protein [Polyangium spumosum]|uniref:Radical SAM protein n=1 Tax=Polyangium spumosum TaxID=889282 RepID=A0A6N7PK27_9BACT|nr:radical SAM protein [Polyangium spumosum]MRG92393.1 radical SAM protein [Polyangium spumosum]
MPLRRVPVIPDEYFPAYVVWELTLRCDQPCAHCGSRAGGPRTTELGTAEALGVVRQLKERGAREVVLIGGEAYLHEGFLEIVRALREAGIRPTMTTGGRGIDAPLARAMKDAGLHSVSVSVDGLAPAHDLIRRAKSSFESATRAIGHLRGAGLLVAANTNVNRVNRGDLEPLYEHLRAQGIVAWQVQITAALGRAADRPDMLLQPYDLLDLVPRVAALKRRAFRDGITLMPGNNLGYFGPEEALLRSVKEGGRDHFVGCQAGKRVLGIESDGAVKGCPSLQSTPYVGGSLRERPLGVIWDEAPALAFARHRTPDDLWGFCRACPFAEVCMGGCTFTAHALFGRPGNNPYCHFRARTLAAEGKRERLVPAAPAEGRPFDHGLFELVLESTDAPESAPLGPPERLVQITRRP